MRCLPPPPDLRPWIEGGVVVHAPAALGRTCFTARLSSQLVVRLSGRVTLEAPGGGAAADLPSAALIGPSCTPSGFRHEGEVAAVGLILRPEAVAGWFGPDGPALVDRSVALDDLLGPQWAAAQAAVQEAGDDTQRLGILFQALRQAIQRDPRLDERRRQALRLQQAIGLPALGEGSDDGDREPGTSIGTRQLQRQFRRSYGLSPKQFQTLCRLRGVLHGALRPAETGALAGHATRGQGAALAQAAGYFDQAHLARDLRRLAGAPLGDLLRRARPTADGTPGEHWPLAVGAATALIAPAIERVTGPATG